ncbi:hypothetical protein [Microcoleus vaginatus]|uniref:hypothetical protein n=1 Tax=Microcoleus vaginatus TaxID=119532 RepID=UPI0032A8B7FE
MNYVTKSSKPGELFEMKKTEACPVFKISHNIIKNQAFRHKPETFKKIRIVPGTTLVFKVKRLYFQGTTTTIYLESDD